MEGVAIMLWNASVFIHAPIETVWSFFDGDEEHLKKIMPGIVSNTPIMETPDKVGSQYLQRYKEGKRVMEYVFTVTAYENTPTHKKLGFHFTIAKAFDVHGSHAFKALNGGTQYDYKVKTMGLKWWAKLLMMVMRNRRAVDDHMSRVKRVVESAS